MPITEEEMAKKVDGGGRGRKSTTWLWHLVDDVKIVPQQFGSPLLLF